MYGHVTHCFDSDYARVASLEDRLRRVTQERDELLREAEYTLRYGGADDRQAVLDHDSSGRREEEGRQAVIRRVLTEVAAGYNWPDDESRGLYLRGYPPTRDFNPTPVERVRRAVVWGDTELRSELARRIDPDRRG